jgi:hypothetical protein
MPDTADLSPIADQQTVSAYPAALRAAAGGLLLVSGLSLPLLLSRVLLASDPAMTPPMVLRAFLAFSALPAIAAWLVRRVLRAQLGVTGDALEVQVGGKHLAVLLEEIAAIEPWRIPLPEPGVNLRLRSGQRFPLGLGADDPSPIIAPIVARIDAQLDAAGDAAASGALAHPTLIYARVKLRSGRFGWRRVVVKYPLFGALAGGVLFNAHQQIAYGGTFGQYDLEGALPFARTFLVYWATVTVYLVLYASVWRWPAELLAWLAARRGETVASRVRRIAELVCRVVYYGGVPALLALRFAA